MQRTARVLSLTLASKPYPGKRALLHQSLAGTCCQSLRAIFHLVTYIPLPTDRQSSNTDNLPLRVTAPIRISTLAATKHSVPTAVLGAQDRGNAAQLPSALISDRIHQQTAASDSTELSESEQHILQHLGWSPAGRRGLETVSAPPVTASPSKSSGATVLKYFWKHFTGLSWLVPQEQPLVQHVEGLTAGQHAQHAKQDAFKLAQQVLQQAATDTLYLQSMRHIDVVTSKTARSSQQHGPSAGHMDTTRSGSDKLTSNDSKQDPGLRDLRTPVLPQHAQGGDAGVTSCVSSPKLLLFHA